MKTNDVVLQKAALTNFLSSKSFSEGGSVFVRVIKNLGGGNYFVSLGGSRLSVRSETPLEETSTLLAKIKISGEKIMLIRQPVGKFAEVSAQKISANVTADGALSGAAAAYLKRIGLTPDSLSVSMLSQMQELGLSFNIDFMNRIRLLAGKFRGREKRAAEIALALEQKGLVADEKSVLAIMDDSGSQDERSGMQNHRQKNFQSSAKDVPDTEDEESASFERLAIGVFGEFFAGLFNKTKDSGDIKYGHTALFNHFTACKSKTDFTKTWIRLPFEFSFTNSGRDCDGRGCVNLLIKTDSKSLEKAAFTFTLDKKQYAAVLYPNRNTVDKIKIYVQDKTYSADFADAVQNKFPNSEIELIEYDASGGQEFFPDENIFYRVDGTI
ncbi:MAG: hypothetical protein ACFNKL_03405 [Treponema sp.]